MMGSRIVTLATWGRSRAGPHTRGEDVMILAAPEQLISHTQQAKPRHALCALELCSNRCMAAAACPSGGFKNPVPHCPCIALCNDGCRFWWQTALSRTTPQGTVMEACCTFPARYRCGTTCAIAFCAASSLRSQTAHTRPQLRDDSTLTTQHTAHCPQHKPSIQPTEHCRCLTRCNWHVRGCGAGTRSCPVLLSAAAGPCLRRRQCHQHCEQHRHVQQCYGVRRRNVPAGAAGALYTSMCVHARAHERAHMLVHAHIFSTVSLSRPCLPCMSPCRCGR